MAEVTVSRKLAAEFIGTAALVTCGPGTAAATFMIAKSTGAQFSMAGTHSTTTCKESEP